MDTDVLIVGAGLAGATLAFNLQKIGISVVLVDHKVTYPDAFRAEKIEPDQAEAMRKLGIFDCRVPNMEPLGETVNYRNGQRGDFNTVEQYGLKYGDFINNIRSSLLPENSILVDTVKGLKASDKEQIVELRNAGSVSCRIVVLASGGTNPLVKKLNYRKRPNTSLRTFNVGFYIEPENADAFKFTGFNYFLEPPHEGVDYLTLFKIGEQMRANLFTQLKNDDSNTKKLRQDAYSEIVRHFPDLVKQIGEFNICSKPQFFFTDFYRLKNLGQPGVVAIADEYQSVCPATGTGLTKVCTDVDLLANNFIPKWFESKHVDAEAINEFYFDERKWACDQESLYQWIYYRNKAAGKWMKQWSKIDTRIRTRLKLW